MLAERCAPEQRSGFDLSPCVHQPHPSSARPVAKILYIGLTERGWRTGDGGVGRAWRIDPRQSRGPRGAGVKPSAFDYRTPTTLGEAIGLLAADPDALVISGGQSLMPLLAFRFAATSLLVDLCRVPGLDTIA